MESLRPPDRCKLPTVSFSRPDSPLQRHNDSFVESQQCSADPSAFVGFHVPLRTKEGAVKEKKQTLRLVLDLDATTETTARSSGFQVVSHLNVNPFNELLAANTQDDENLISLASEKEKKEKTLLENRSKYEHKSRSASPPPFMLKAVELAWRARRQEIGNIRKDEREESLTEYSEYSEDLAPRIFHDTLSKAVEKENLVEEEKELRISTEDDDRETDDEEIENTQPLEEDEMTGSYERLSEYEVETEVYPHPDAGTLPFVADSSLIDDADETTRGNRKGERNSVYDKLDKRTCQRTCEDEVTSHVGSQEFLTPRVNPSHVEKPEYMNENEDEQDDCVPNQPHKIGTEGEPFEEPCLPSPQKDKKSDDQKMNSDVAEVDPQTKAIRSLEFSFSMPESQDHEPHFSASLTSDSTPAKKIETHSKRKRPIPFESSISPVYQPTPPPVNESSNVKDSIGLLDIQVRSKRDKESLMLLDQSPDTKKQKSSAESIESPKQMITTPNTGKQKHNYISPNGDVSSKELNVADPQTPRPPARRSSRSTQSTPSSTPHVRTRTRTLMQVPSQRAYASRSRTLFKYKFEFCLTGFVKTGEEMLIELIEGHGGKIPERYQDVLYKENSKAVVIATPVSWRKRKFMQAVACGIPVVHTDWIKDCIDTGSVIPFEGYQVPTGYSVTTRKFECFPPKELNIFQGYSFGIVSDGSLTSKSEAKDKANLMTFILKACGAHVVYEDLSSQSSDCIDVVLCDEYTATCRYYKRKRRIPVKNFQWVTECMILQRIIDLKEPVLEPQRVGRDNVVAASATIGDSDNSTLKLYTGELVMADISGSAADHYLLFNVCEILSIHIYGRTDEGSQSKRKESKDGGVMLRVGMLKREPYNPELSKTPVKILDISSSQVKRRVVAISKEDYAKLKYKDESIFYLEDDRKTDKPECGYLTQ